MFLWKRKGAGCERALTGQYGCKSEDVQGCGKSIFGRDGGEGDFYIEIIGK